MTKLPNTASDFVRFMNEVWLMKSIPAPNGGMTLYGSPLYDEWHDAHYAIQEAGAIRTGTTRVNGEDWAFYRFAADEGQYGVKVNHAGSAVELSSHRYGRHNPAGKDLGRQR